MNAKIVFFRLKKILSSVFLAVSVFWLCTILSTVSVNAETRTYTLTITLPSDYIHDPAAVASANAVSPQTCQYVYIDAAQKPAVYSACSDSVTVSFDADDTALPKTATLYLYKWNSATSRQIPRGMHVWELSLDEQGGVIATSADDLTDLLSYKAFNIYTTGDFGIRAQSGIDRAKRDTLIANTSKSGNGFTLLEYGQLCMGPVGYANSGNNMNYSNGNPLSSFDVTTGKNKYIAEEDGKIYFSNSRVFPEGTYEEFTKEYYFRPYAKLTNINGEEVFIYGATMHYSANTIVRGVYSTLTSDSQIRLKRLLSTVDMHAATILYFGESIMEGCDGNNTSSIVNLPIYSQVTASLCSKYTYKDSASPVGISYAHGGATFCTPGVNGDTNNIPYFVDQAKANITGDAISNVKLIFVMGGVNDWWFKEQGNDGFGELNSDGSVKDYGVTNTYCSSVYKTLKDLSDYFTNAKIILVTPPQAMSGSTPAGELPNETTGKTMNDYIQVQRDIVGYLKNTGINIDLIDVYDGWVTGGTTDFHAFIPDGVHPTQDGYSAIASIIYNKLMDGILEKVE